MTREQLGALILDSERQLYSTAKTILYSDQDCADAIQDTIVKAFSKIDTLKNDKYARTWLVRILINECYSILRKSSKLVSLEEMNDKGESGGSMKTCGGADKEAEKRADYAELYRAVNSLKEELRLPVILYYIEDFNIREIAQILDITEEKGVFDQKIYLLCPDEYRVITIYIGDDVSKEDAVKVAENLEITENDKMLETAKMYTWSDEVNPKVETGGEMVTSVPENKLKVHKIGEDFTLSASGEDKDGNNIVNDKISACVDSVQIADNLKLLNGAALPEEWKNVTDSNGKLVKNKVSYIKSGDGVNSVDQIVKTENVDQKLVYATITYTNNSDQEINHMLYIGDLALIRHKNGKYHIYNAMEQSGDGYDRVSWDGVAHTAEMTYSSVREDYGNGGNYISSLKRGESIQVNMAWIVNENDLADMYLNLDGEGGAYDFGEGIVL